MAKIKLTRRALILGSPSLVMSSAALAAFLPTPGTTEGPFYPVRMPRDIDADLVRVDKSEEAAVGDILHLTGRVLDANARPVAKARVEIWQCDATGIYLHPGDRRFASRDQGFQGFGHAVTDSTGRIVFRTIVPVSYPGRTPHIHAKIFHGGRKLLTTQLYRAGHAQNQSDILFRRLSPGEQQRVSMTIKPRTVAASVAYETEIELVI